MHWNGWQRVVRQLFPRPARPRRVSRRPVLEQLENRLAPATFNGGVSVAVGDFNNDNVSDIAVGAGAGPASHPHVKVFSGADGSLLHNFMAFDASFQGGVYVAAGDVNDDG